MLTYITSSGLGWGWCLIAAYIVLSLWSPSDILLDFSLPSFKNIQNEKLKRNAALFWFWILVSVRLRLQTLSPLIMKLRRRREDAEKKGKFLYTKLSFPILNPGQKGSARDNTLSILRDYKVFLWWEALVILLKLQGQWTFTITYLLLNLFSEYCKQKQGLWLAQVTGAMSALHPDVITNTDNFRLLAWLDGTHSHCRMSGGVCFVTPLCERSGWVVSAEPALLHSRDQTEHQEWGISDDLLPVALPFWKQDVCQSPSLFLPQRTESLLSVKPHTYFFIKKRLLPLSLPWSVEHMLCITLSSVALPSWTMIPLNKPSLSSGCWETGLQGQEKDKRIRELYLPFSSPCSWWWV